MYTFISIILFYAIGNASVETCTPDMFKGFASPITIRADSLHPSPNGFGDEFIKQQFSTLIESYDGTYITCSNIFNQKVSDSIQDFDEQSVVQLKNLIITNIAKQDIYFKCVNKETKAAFYYLGYYNRTWSVTSKLSFKSSFIALVKTPTRVFIAAKGRFYICQANAKPEYNALAYEGDSNGETDIAVFENAQFELSWIRQLVPGSNSNALMDLQKTYGLQFGDGEMLKLFSGDDATNGLTIDYFNSVVVTKGTSGSIQAQTRLFVWKQFQAMSVTVTGEDWLEFLHYVPWNSHIMGTDGRKREVAESLKDVSINIIHLTGGTYEANNPMQSHFIPYTMRRFSFYKGDLYVILGAFPHSKYMISYLRGSSFFLEIKNDPLDNFQLNLDQWDYSPSSKCKAMKGGAWNAWDEFNLQKSTLKHLSKDLKIDSHKSWNPCPESTFRVLSISLKDGLSNVRPVLKVTTIEGSRNYYYTFDNVDFVKYFHNRFMARLNLEPV